jgi:hypothetical protein
LASDPSNFANIVAFFPELERELDDTLKDAFSKVARPGFHHLKDQVIVAKAFLSERPNLAKEYQRELVALIRDAGDLKTLKAHLKGWETSSTAGSSSILSVLTSFLFSKEQTSRIVDTAARRSKDTKDFEFLATLPEKVSKEPLLDQLTQDAMIEVYGYLQEFIQHCLPRLCSHVHDIKQKAMYHQVELRANKEDQQRKMSSRRDLFDELKVAQTHVNLKCVLCCPQVHLTLLKCVL